MLYVGNKHTAFASGETIKPVRCERCGDVYYYKMLRESRGEGSSPYFLDEGGAARRAADRASKSLQSKLERGCEAVPCPACGLFQPNMVALLRRRRYGYLLWVGIFVPMAVLLGFGAFSGNRRMGPDENPELLWAGLGLAGLIAGFVFWQKWRLSRAYDPNATPPALPPHNPVPLKLLNPPEQFAMPPRTDLYFAWAEDYKRALAAGQQVPPQACLLVPAAR